MGGSCQEGSRRELKTKGRSGSMVKAGRHVAPTSSNPQAKEGAAKPCFPMLLRNPEPVLGCSVSLQCSLCLFPPFTCLSYLFSSHLLPVLGLVWAVGTNSAQHNQAQRCSFLQTNNRSSFILASLLCLCIGTCVISGSADRKDKELSPHIPNIYVYILSTGCESTPEKLFQGLKHYCFSLHCHLVPWVVEKLGVENARSGFTLALQTYQ